MMGPECFLVTFTACWCEVHRYEDEWVRHVCSVVPSHLSLTIASTKTAQCKQHCCGIATLSAHTTPCNVKVHISCTFSHLHAPRLQSHNSVWEKKREQEWKWDVLNLYYIWFQQGYTQNTEDAAHAMDFRFQIHASSSNSKRMNLISSVYLPESALPACSFLASDSVMKVRWWKSSTVINKCIPAAAEFYMLVNWPGSHLILGVLVFTIVSTNIIAWKQMHTLSSKTFSYLGNTSQAFRLSSRYISRDKRHMEMHK